MMEDRRRDNLICCMNMVNMGHNFTIIIILIRFIRLSPESELNLQVMEYNNINYCFHIGI